MGFTTLPAEIEINQLNKGGLLPAGYAIHLYLRWNAWPSTDQDYDLYLVRWNGSQWVTVAGSTNFQTGTQPPVEELHYGVPSDGYYGVVISEFSADGTQILDLTGYNAPDFKVDLKDRSLIDPATAPMAFSVAALNVSGLSLESYSSQGPSLGGGGSLGTGVDQPRIAGYDNVETWAAEHYYGIRFRGTSAATPHTAGAAALVFSAFPSFTPDDVIAFLESRAKDIGPQGYDHVYGMGRLWLGSPPPFFAPAILAPTETLTNDNTPDYSWGAVDGAVAYEIQIATDSKYRTIVRLDDALNSTSYTPSALPDGRYYWRVRALNQAYLDGPWASHTLTIDTLPPPIPLLASPKELAGVSGQTPSVAWKASSGANFYQLQIASDSGMSTLLVDESTASRSIRVTNPLDYGRYYWQVRARDAAGNWSGWSDVQSFDITIMRSPGNSTGITDTTPSFRWNRAPGAAGYQLEVATDSAFGGADIITLETPSGTGYTVPGSDPLPHGVYYWRVNIDTGTGSYETSPVYWVLTVTPRPPGSPRLSTPTSGAYLNTSTPQLDWQSVTDGVNYEVQISAVSNFSVLVQTVTVNGLNTVASSLADGRYYWRVRALNYLDVPGSWSAKWSFTVDTVAPLAPDLSKPADAAVSTDTTPKLGWFTSAGAVAYELQLDTSDPPQWSVYLGSGRAYTPRSPLLRDRTYHWRVRAIDRAGNVSEWSTSWNVFITSPTNDAPLFNHYEISQPTLTWTLVTWAAGYEIQIDDDSHFRSPDYQSGALPSSSLSHTLTRALPNGTWYWRVRALDASGKAGSWNTGSFTIEA